MGIALFSIANLFTPLQSLADRWMPVRRSHGINSSGLRYVGVRPSCTSRPGPSACDASQSVRPLRVVRMIDAQQPDRRPSRVVISGRMADVCAELDRLAALEEADTARRHALMH